MSPPSQKVGHPEGPHPPEWAVWLIAALLVAAVVVAFWPSLWNGFNYDDETNIVRNFRYRGLGAEQLRWMWTTFKAGHYQPLSWMSLGLDYVLWGDKPFGYHLTNLVLHALNVVLVFRLASVLIGWHRSPTPKGWGTGAPAHEWGILVGAGVAALLFAVHPLRVESVAWVTERRDVLSSCFLFATVLLYLRAQRSGISAARRWWLAAAVSAFVLSLLSRAMGVTLPIVLLVLDWYPLRHFGRIGAPSEKVSGASASGLDRAAGSVGGTQEARAERLRLLTPLREKLPFLLPAVAAAVVAPIAQKSVGAAALLEHHGVEARVAQACYGLGFYFWKTIAPWGLVPMYELHPPLKLLTLKYGLSLLGVTVAVFSLMVIGRRYRAVASGVICYGVLLSPVLGFVQSGQQEVADRYSYLPAVVIAVLIGGSIAGLWESASRRRLAAALAVAGCAAGAALGALTWRQCGVWRDAQTLWSHAIAAGPPSSVAHYNLGSVYGQQGRVKDAQVEYIKALAINPRYPDAYYNLGNTYTELGDLPRAEKAYWGALRINDKHVTAWYHLGNALANQGKVEPAIAAYRKAAALRPNHAETWVNLGAQLWKRDSREEAIAAYRRAIEIDPKLVEARINLGGALAATGLPEEGLAELREAVRLNPNHAEARRRLEALEEHLGQQP